MEAPQMSTRILIVTLLVLIASISATAKPAGKDQEGGFCGMTRDELSECKPAVTTGTAVPPPPTAPCCKAIQHANVTCLCTFRDNKYLPLFGINATLAMELPTKCDINENAHC